MSVETVNHTRISRRLSRVKSSITLAIAAKAKQMQAAGIDVLSLSTGEPDFPTPDVIKQAAIRAINENFTYYTQSNGIPELREAIAEKFTRENNIPTEPGQVLVSVGGKHSIFNALSAIVDDGDEVLFPIPYWVSYPEMVSLVGGVPVSIATSVETNYKMTPEQFEAAITERTKAVFINSPANPSGVMYSQEELEALGRIIAKHNLFVISDELYEKIIYDDNRHFSIGSMPELKELAITVNGVSKSYSMTGWRLGYMCGPKDVMAAAAKIQSQVTSNPTSISQKAALAALTLAGDDVMRMVQAFAKRRELIVGLLSELPGVTFPKPDGAFYIFANFNSYFTPAIPDSDALARYLLDEHHVALAPGSAFGDNEALRISYACSDDDTRKAVSRIAHALKVLPQ